MPPEKINLRTFLKSNMRYVVLQTIVGSFAIGLACALLIPYFVLFRGVGTMVSLPLTAWYASLSYASISHDLNQNFSELPIKETTRLKKILKVSLQVLAIFCSASGCLLGLFIIGELG